MVLKKISYVISLECEILFRKAESIIYSFFRFPTLLILLNSFSTVTWNSKCFWVDFTKK